jgi:hypothetical protein
VLCCFLLCSALGKQQQQQHIARGKNMRFETLLTDMGSVLSMDEKMEHIQKLHRLNEKCICDV